MKSTPIPVIRLPHTGEMVHVEAYGHHSVLLRFEGSGEQLIFDREELEEALARTLPRPVTLEDYFRSFGRG